MFYFFFQAEDGIRDAQESRGLGDVYKRQFMKSPTVMKLGPAPVQVIASMISMGFTLPITFAARPMQLELQLEQLEPELQERLAPGTTVAVSYTHLTLPTKRIV
eukprot:TRINITY_DN35567_c0_g1_i1.p1 TRINITY_DN35567_c0_g1~~TRINITY_DN35567_c0_g1_i1.p1  ORF type:complete len:104 (-),score=27.63 TRINITY_DN35567_c0_g1_i1:144-455(-)